MYKPMVKYLGALKRMYLLLQSSQNIDAFLKTKQFTRLLEFMKHYKQNPFRDFFFHYLPKLYFGFNISVKRYIITMIQ